ncbi:MAG: hypothetical protein ABW032_05705 [Burkholderiaceae bacterium]
MPSLINASWAMATNPAALTTHAMRVATTGSAVRLATHRPSMAGPCTPTTLNAGRTLPVSAAAHQRRTYVTEPQFKALEKAPWHSTLSQVSGFSPRKGHGEAYWKDKLVSVYDGLFRQGEVDARWGLFNLQPFLASQPRFKNVGLNRFYFDAGGSVEGSGDGAELELKMETKANPGVSDIKQIVKEHQVAALTIGGETILPFRVISTRSKTLVVGRGGDVPPDHPMMRHLQAYADKHRGGRLDGLTEADHASFREDMQRQGLGREVDRMGYSVWDLDERIDKSGGRGNSITYAGNVRRNDRARMNGEGAKLDRAVRNSLKAVGSAETA